MRNVGCGDIVRAGLQEGTENGGFLGAVRGIGEGHRVDGDMEVLLGRIVAQTVGDLVDAVIVQIDEHRSH